MARSTQRPPAPRPIGPVRVDAIPTEERMADVNVNNRGTGGGGGSTMMLGLLVVVVLALVIWLVARGGGDDADVEVNLPKVETTEIDVPENVNVEVKSSGGSP